MRAIVTVNGKDKVGIIATVCTLLMLHNVNVLDISQTILQGYFTMTMLVDPSASDIPFAELVTELDRAGEKLHMSIRVQREDIFDAMYKV